MLRSSFLAAGFAAGVFAAPWVQDPQKPAPPPPPAVAKQEPVGRAPRHALEGVYRLVARVVDDKKDGGGSRGYLAITQRHLFLCLAAAGPDRDIPLVRAGVRTWKVKDDLVGATIQLGWFNDKDGHIVVEPPGTEERRQIQLIQGGLRVTQDDHNWLEFERVE